MSFIDERNCSCYVCQTTMSYPKGDFSEGIRRAPDRGFRLTQAQTEIALHLCVTFLKIPPRVDPEFLEELNARSDLWLSLPSKIASWKTNR